MERLDEIRSAKRAEISFGDVIAAEGRTEAIRLIASHIADKDQRAGEIAAAIDRFDRQMRELTDKHRVADIKVEFSLRLLDYSNSLGARIGGAKNQALTGVNVGRGSEGPRALMAYYYAFLQTALRHSTSAFCPIVIDAPNQQGQDATNMPRMMQFIISEQPVGSQLIIAAESPFGLSEEVVDVIEVGYKRDQVLREDLYDGVWEAPPYLVN